jgi:hypothetical protein
LWVENPSSTHERRRWGRSESSRARRARCSLYASSADSGFRRLLLAQLPKFPPELLVGHDLVGHRRLLVPHHDVQLLRVLVAQVAPDERDQDVADPLIQIVAVTARDLRDEMLDPARVDDGTEQALLCSVRELAPVVDVVHFNPPACP